MACSVEMEAESWGICPVHEDRPLTGYCDGFRDVFNKLCLANHSLCEDTRPISKITPSLSPGDSTDGFNGAGNTLVKTLWSSTSHEETSDDGIDVTQTLRDVSSELSHMMRIHEASLKDIKVNKTNSMKTIDSIIRLINDNIDKLVREQNNEFSEKEQCVIEKINTLKNLRDKVEIAINNMEIPLNMEQNLHDLHGTGKNLIKHVRDAAHKLEKVEIILVEEITERFVNNVKDFCDRLFNYSIENFREIGVRQTGDIKTCTIMGTCLLEDSETLFVTDWENQKLKRIDATYTVCDSVKFPYNVCDVCQTDLNELAVTMPLVKIVQFVNIDGEMELSRRFNVGDADIHVCRAICYFDHKIIVNCGGLEAESSARVFTKQGQLLQTIQKNKGFDLFKYPTDVDVSDTLSQLFISDEQNGILAFTKYFQYTKTLNIPDIRYPTGIYPFMDCWLLVCCYDTNKVYLVHKDGLEARTLVSRNEGIKLPLSPCFDSKRSKLFVGMKGSDIVPVFDVKKVLKIH